MNTKKIANEIQAMLEYDMKAECTSKEKSRYVGMTKYFEAREFKIGNQVFHITIDKIQK